MTSAADVPQIDSDPCPVTLINVSEIDSDKLDLFFAEWRKRVEFMAKKPGFRSLKLHRALTPDAASSQSTLPGGTVTTRCARQQRVEVTAPELSEQQTLND